MNSAPASLLHAWLVGFGALLGSGVLAGGLGYAAQLAFVWIGSAS